MEGWFITLIPVDKCGNRRLGSVVCKFRISYLRDTILRSRKAWSRGVVRPHNGAPQRVPRRRLRAISSWVSRHEQHDRLPADSA
ncbi:hypothetical protein, partial [Burkholderia gladioli]|uniref:hypothetical protein n=1 Tax=Burkholderia gladioli TaxID=28095 RepID=UPI001ABB389D